MTLTEPPLPAIAPPAPAAWFAERTDWLTVKPGIAVLNSALIAPPFPAASPWVSVTPETPTAADSDTTPRTRLVWFASMMLTPAPAPCSVTGHAAAAHAV